MRAVWGGLVLAGCVGGGPPADGAVSAPPGTLALTTLSDDYTVGTLSLVDPDSLEVWPDVLGLHADAVLRAEGDDLFVVNRLQMDTVRRYTRGPLGAPTWETSTGRGSNPHAVATCAEGQLLVTRYEESGLLVLDRETGERLGEIDLGGYADDDGVPEMSDLLAVEGRAWVGLQRLRRRDGWEAEPTGAVVEIDCDRRVVTRSWSVGPNPVLRADPSAPGTIVVVAGDGLWRLSPDADALDGPWHTAGAPVVDAAFGPDGAGVLIRRDGAWHEAACVRAPDDPAPSVGFRVPNYLSGAAVDGAGRAWLAARRGWEDPTDPGGLLGLRLDGCAALTDVPVRATLAPFSVAVW